MPMVNKMSLRFTLHLTPEFVLLFRRASLPPRVLRLQTAVPRHLY
jgi:hypothetical protein